MPYSDPDKQREYQRQWVSERRARFFANKSCVNCGSRHNLELDHKNPVEKVSHRIWSWAWSKILEEVKKCQILCESCHMEKTLIQRKPTEHGKLWMYSRHGCRCDLCKNAKLESSRKYNLTRVR